MPPAVDFKVGLAQIAPELMNLEANRDKHLEYIHKASEQGVELLVFPELSLTGYHFDYQFPDIALHMHDSFFGPLADAAPDMQVVLGFVEESNASLFYNSAAILHRGKVSFVHHKVNLPTYGGWEEGKWFSEGRSINTYQSDDLNAGLLICADVWNPGLVNLVAMHGAKLLIVPINSSDSTEYFDTQSNWRLTMEFYSFIYGMPTIMVNRVGGEKNARYWGRSTVHDAFGKLIAEAPAYEETLLVTSINWQSVKRARFALPTLRDANFSLTLREMKRLDQILA